MSKKSERIATFLGIFSLVALVLIIYSRAFGFGYISYDDLALLPGNPDRFFWNSGQAISWAFTNFTLQDWAPVTWLSLLIDHSLFGFDAGAYHRTNIIFYALSCILLFIVLKKLTSRQGLSFIVAVLFAIHPLHVESVVWISQRKEMVASIFWLLTIWGYLNYTGRCLEGARARTCSQEGGVRFGWYFATLILFALGLMSKPTLVTLPLVLLLLDFLFFKRKDRGKCFIEKIPFFLLVAGSCYMTLQAVSVGGTGSVRTFEEITVGHRLSNALFSYAIYVWKTIVPYPLHFLYAQKESFSIFQLFLSGSSLVAMTAYAVWGIKKRPLVSVGWFWFAIVLVPMIGLIQVGGQSMADRYAYFPHMGLLIAFVWGIDSLFETLFSRRPEDGGLSVVKTKVAWVLLMIVIPTYSFIAWKQVGYWRDSETLYQHTLKHNENNYFIQEALCEEYSFQERYSEAVGRCEAAIRIDSSRAKVFQTLARAYFKQKKYQEAMSSFMKFLEIVVDVRLKEDPQLEDKRRAILDNFKKRYGRIIEQPSDPHGFYLMGNFWTQTKDYLLSIDFYRHAMKLAPKNSAIHVNLANVYFLMGEMEKAEVHFKAGVKIDRNNVNAHFNYGLYLKTRNKNQKAREYFMKALKIDPNHAGAKKHLGL